MHRTLCFDDVLLVPQYSDIESRISVNLSVSGFDVLYCALMPGNSVLTCPIVGSPMDTVMSSGVADILDEFGGFGVLHRYCTIDESIKMFINSKIKRRFNQSMNIMVAVGATGDYVERVAALYKVGCRAFCIDVAHGHHVVVKNALKTLREIYNNDIHIMTGNVATLNAFNDLADWGSNSIRVGIGGGSLCTTRIRTGHGVPTLQSILDCAKSDRDVYLVADGGLRNSGDIVKALAAGADMVMLGSILAGHNESPGDLIDKQGLKHATSQGDIKLFKIFRGMASKEAQLQWRGKVSVIEGESTIIPYKGKLSDTLNNLLEGIRSGLSYSGARTIRELRSKAQFVIVTSSGVRENGPHII